MANPLSIELTARQPRGSPAAGDPPVAGMEASFAKFDHIQYKREHPAGGISRAIQNPLSTPEAVGPVVSPGASPLGLGATAASAKRASGLVSQIQRNSLFQRRRLSPAKQGAAKRKSSIFTGGGTVAMKRSDSHGTSPHTLSSVAMSAFTGMSAIGMVMPVFQDIPEEVSSDEYDTDTDTDSEDGEFEAGVTIDMEL